MPVQNNLKEHLAWINGAKPQIPLARLLDTFLKRDPAHPARRNHPSLQNITNIQNTRHQETVRAKETTYPENVPPPSARSQYFPPKSPNLPSNRANISTSHPIQQSTQISQPDPADDDIIVLPEPQKAIPSKRRAEEPRTREQPREPKEQTTIQTSHTPSSSDKLEKYIRICEAKINLLMERNSVMESTAISLDAKQKYLSEKYQPRFRKITDNQNKIRPQLPFLADSQNDSSLIEKLPSFSESLHDAARVSEKVSIPEVRPQITEKQIPDSLTRDAPVDLDLFSDIDSNSIHSDKEEPVNMLGLAKTMIPTQTPREIPRPTIPSRPIIQTPPRPMRQPEFTSRPEANTLQFAGSNNYDDPEDSLGEGFMDGLRTPTQDRDNYNDLSDFIDEEESVDGTFQDQVNESESEVSIVHNGVDIEEIKDIKLSQDVADRYDINYDDIEEIDEVDFTTQLNTERELADVIEITDDEDQQEGVSGDILALSDTDFGDTDDEELVQIMESRTVREPFMTEVYDVLRRVFRLDGFRPNQMDAIVATLQGHDVFVLMPTGGGKSLCYQLPALIKTGKTSGTTIVVSPLISLMQDQVQHLTDKNIRAGMVSSRGSDSEKLDIIRQFREGALDLVYLSPEMITASGRVKDIIAKLAQNNQLARIVVDEAHCVSSWGHDFRPDYKGLSMFKTNYPNVPIMALTATASEKVRLDIVHNLRMNSPKLFKQSFNRTNLFYEVRWKDTGYLDWMRDYICGKFRGKSGIIYCHSKSSCEQTSEKLNSWGVKSAFYHAGMDPNERLKIQVLWQQNKIQLICATIAFGMGIDKPDVRFVIHLFLPRTLEGYYQETGRAGRDGNPSECIMFYGYKDARSLQSFIYRDDSLDEAGKESHLTKLRQVVQYCENTSDCRRKQVLHYFNERFDPAKCKAHCDNCRRTGNTKSTSKDVTEHAKNIIGLVESVQNDKVTVLHCQDIYKGSKGSKIVRQNHHMNPYHGRGKDVDRRELERIFFHLLSERCLVEYQVMSGSFASNYVKLGRSAGDIARGKRITILVSENTDNGRGPSLSALAVGVPSNLGSYRFTESFVSAREIHNPNDASDLQSLKTVRQQAAQQLRVSPTLVVSDATLSDMASKLPTNKRDFGKLSQIEKGQLESFSHFKLVLTTLSRKRKKGDKSSYFSQKKSLYKVSKRPRSQKKSQRGGKSQSKSKSQSMALPL